MEVADPTYHWGQDRPGKVLSQDQAAVMGSAAVRQERGKRGNSPSRKEHVRGTWRLGSHGIARAELQEGHRLWGNSMLNFFFPLPW